MNKNQKKEVEKLMEKLNKELEAADEISNTLAEPAGNVNDIEVTEADLAELMNDDGVEESKSDDATRAHTTRSARAGSRTPARRSTAASMPTTALPNLPEPPTRPAVVPPPAIPA